MAANKPDKAPEQFIQLIKQAMDEHPEKPSLREVARRADLSVAYLSYLLSGDRGAPSNEAIAQLESVLGIPKGDLFTAAGKPDDVALEFFRKDEGASIVRKLAPLPSGKLSEISRLIEKHLKKKQPARK